MEDSSLILLNIAPAKHWACGVTPKHGPEAVNLNNGIPLGALYAFLECLINENLPKSVKQA
jgi:hypothetical protein